MHLGAVLVSRAGLCEVLDGAQGQRCRPNGGWMYDRRGGLRPCRGTLGPDLRAARDAGQRRRSWWEFERREGLGGGSHRIRRRPAPSPAVEIRPRLRPDQRLPPERALADAGFSGVEAHRLTGVRAAASRSPKQWRGWHCGSPSRTAPDIRKADGLAFS